MKFIETKDFNVTSNDEPANESKSRSFTCISECQSDDDDGIYRGKSLGRFNSYHHQVTGEIYAVDEYTLLFRNFNYDGNGADTFFWAGASNRPGPQGFIVPDKHGK